MALPKVPDTIQLRGKYHVKIRVDARILEHWDGKAVYQRSLKTSDPVSAAREVRAIRAIMDAQIATAKAEEGMRELARYLPEDQRTILEKAGGIDGLKHQFEQRLIGLSFLEAGAPADAGEFDVETDTSGEPQKIIVEHERDPEELEDERVTHEALVRHKRAKLNTAGRVLKKVGHHVALQGDVHSLSDLIDEWSPSVDPQTADAARYYVRRSNELFGELGLKELETQHLREFLKEARGLPAVSSAKLSDGRYVRDLSFTESVGWASKNKKETLGDSTIAKYHAMLKRLSAFAVGQGYLKEDPWHSVRLPKTKKKYSERKSASRRPFTAAEVQVIFDFLSSSKEAQYGRETIDFWAPHIGAYQGMRLQEICQLRVCDFGMREGVFSIRITDEGENMRAKSQATVRWVPMHPRLVDLGLQDRVSLLAEEEGDKEASAFLEWDRYGKKLRPLTHDKRGRVSGNYGSRFQYLREKKLKIVGGGVCFHSFRHRLQDAADNAGIPESHRRYLTGRANPDAVEAGYGNGASMKHLFQSLKSIDPTLE